MDIRNCLYPEDTFSYLYIALHDDTVIISWLHMRLFPSILHQMKHP